MDSNIHLNIAAQSTYHVVAEKPSPYKVVQEVRCIIFWNIFRCCISLHGDC